MTPHTTQLAGLDKEAGRINTEDPNRSPIDVVLCVVRVSPFLSLSLSLFSSRMSYYILARVIIVDANIESGLLDGLDIRLQLCIIHIRNIIE